MYPYNTLVPIRIARLIYGLTNKLLSPDENLELDEWINLLDDNMEIFDVLNIINKSSVKRSERTPG